ncbi:MAG: hypothetical protein ACYTGH_07010, partial [Planctomycetota bacterium]
MSALSAVPIRAIQLDLARQMETVDYIEDFIQFASRQGYNALVLYLEARVRTDSFPYPAPEESYTLEEMRRVVTCAHTHGL